MAGAEITSLGNGLGESRRGDTDAGADHAQGFQGDRPRTRKDRPLH